MCCAGKVCFDGKKWGKKRTPFQVGVSTVCYSCFVVTAEGAGGEGRKVPIALGFASPWVSTGLAQVLVMPIAGMSLGTPQNGAGGGRGPLSAPIPAQGSSTGSVWKDKCHPEPGAMDSPFPWDISLSLLCHSMSPKGRVVWMGAVG